MISVRSLKNIKGFTLVELMIVIAVIAILATLALFGLTGAQKGARDTQRLSVLNNLRIAMERYNADKNAYPQGTFSQVLGSLVAFNYLTGAIFDPGCGTGQVVLTSATYAGASGIAAVPCGATVSPTYSAAVGASGYTFFLVKEANNGLASVMSPQ